MVSYALDMKSGLLAGIEAAPIASNLAYLFADATGRYLLGASYGENRASLYDAARIAKGDGAALQFVDGIQNVHSAVSTRAGRFAYVISSLGADTIHCFEIRDGALHPLDVVTVEQGFGPRHPSTLLAR